MEQAELSRREVLSSVRTGKLDLDGDVDGTLDTGETYAFTEGTDATADEGDTRRGHG